MTATLIFTAGLLIGALLGVSVMAFIQGAARLGEDDLPFDRVKVDQDGESTPARNQWVNAGAKAPHVE